MLQVLATLLIVFLLATHNSDALQSQLVGYVGMRYRLKNNLLEAIVNVAHLTKHSGATNDPDRVYVGHFSLAMILFFILSIIWSSYTQHVVSRAYQCLKRDSAAPVVLVKV